MNLYGLTQYMIENKLFKSKEEAMGRMSVCFMIGQLTQEQLQKLTSLVDKKYSIKKDVLVES